MPARATLTVRSCHAGHMGVLDKLHGTSKMFDAHVAKLKLHTA